MSKDNGGPAFPTDSEHQNGPNSYHFEGMTLRDYFAANMKEDDRLVKCIRAMDDSALAVFAIAPNSEREEWITEIDDACEYIGLAEVEKIAKRLEIEAKAIARVRYMQADAMLEARK